MTTRPPLDVAALKASFQKRCAQTGVDPQQGSTSYQVVHFKAAERKQAQIRTGWWLDPRYWLAPPSTERSSMGVWYDGELLDFLDYKPPKKGGLLIRKLEDTVLESLYWQSRNRLKIHLTYEEALAAEGPQLLKEVLQELHHEDREQLTLKEIHHRQGFELQWIVTKHGTVKLSRVGVTP